VEDDRAAGDGVPDALRIADVTDKDAGIQPPQGVIVGRTQAEHPHLRPETEQLPDELVAEEPRSAGDTDVPAGPEARMGLHGQSSVKGDQAARRLIQKVWAAAIVSVSGRIV
jgi:hypothetical protein